MSSCRLNIDRERLRAFTSFPQAVAPSPSSSGPPKIEPEAPKATHFVVVREDLPKGVLAAHVAHAAGESGPVPSGSIAVVLGVPGELELLAIAARLTASGVEHVLIREDAGSFAGQATSIGARPVTDRAAIRKVVSSLRLVR